ncbi:hypothetical protein GJ496_005153 [Pomphorhynchus laevis]|nr:hypothetical protein GJ496_005153 [Pomphorhynchus laevis]
MGGFESVSNQKKVGKKIGINGNTYLIDYILGKGGFATVYAATHQRDGRKVAIKETRLSEMPIVKMRHNAVMYLNEIMLLKQLQETNFQNIVHIFDYDFNNESGNTYLVEERGIPFEDIVGKRSRVINEPKRLDYFKGMSEAVAILHDMHIVHADLKPANFIVVHFIIKIIDLGTSFFLPGESISADRHAVGTPGYMAPEQRGVKGRAIYGFKCDIYSLGAILFEMTYGKRVECPPSNKPIPTNENPYLYDMLILCLHPSPKSRPSIHEILSHEYMKYH